jgi:predicted acylesterase/phospholipase RssA
MRALVLSSGGSRGYYHVGALQYLYKNNVQHDIICGTSIGALIGAYLAQYPKGQEELAVNRLWELFSRLRTSDVYTKWKPWGVFQALFNKRSLYNSRPLRDLIDTHIDPLRVQDSGKLLRVGVTLYNPTYTEAQGFSNYHLYTERAPDLRAAIKASTALAPFFEPVTMIEGIGVDGGVQAITPIKAAIDAGATEIDVLVCYPKYLLYPRTEPTVWNDTLYNIDLMVNRLTWIDIERTYDINALVRVGHSSKREIKLNVIHPVTDLDASALEFNPLLGQRLQRQGWEDAKLVLQ